MAIQKDFKKFNAPGYLHEYYSKIGDENSALLKFFHKTYKKLNSKKSLLEFGGGPTIYQLISASSKVKEIIFAEYVKGNREEIKKWAKKDPKAFNWEDYFKFVLKLENKKINDKEIEKIKQRLRGRIKEIIKCDAYKQNPLSPKKYPLFDIVSVCFVPESATDNEKTYQLFINNIASMLKTKGILIMVLLKNAKFYHIGKTKFPAYPVDEKYVKNILENIGFSKIRMESINAEHEQGYEGMVFLTAVKGN
jgi:hypothetical protein